MAADSLTTERLFKIKELFEELADYQAAPKDIVSELESSEPMELPRQVDLLKMKQVIENGTRQAKPSSNIDIADEEVTMGDFEMFFGAVIREHMGAPNFGSAAPKEILVPSSEFYQMWSNIEKKLVTGVSIFSFSPPADVVDRVTRQSQFMRNEAMLLKKVESEIYEDDKEEKLGSANLQSLILSQLSAPMQ